MKSRDVNLYLNFILYAVLGKLAEADTMMRAFGAQLRRVAEMLSMRYPFEPKTLHRGVLIEGAFDPTGREFVSWPESADVAEWFADPRSMMNEYVIGVRPKSVGYLLSIDIEQCVLFHHSWVMRLPDLPTLARRHPQMSAEYADQLAWALMTQHEVITEPPTTWPDLRPFVATRASLDAKLAPPWLLRAERRSEVLS